MTWQLFGSYFLSEIVFCVYSSFLRLEFNPLPDNKILDWSKLKQTADESQAIFPFPMFLTHYQMAKF